MFKKNLIAFNFEKKIGINKQLYKLFATSRSDCRLYLLKHKWVLRAHRESTLYIIGEIRLIYDFWKKKYTRKNKSSPGYYLAYEKYWGLRNSLNEQIHEHYWFYDLFIWTNGVSPDIQTFIQKLLLETLKPVYNDFPSEKSLKKLEEIIWSYMLQIAFLIGLMDNIKKFEIAIYDTPNIYELRWF